MTDVHGFNSFDEMRAYQSGLQEVTLAKIKPWQQRMTHGDHFLYFTGFAENPVLYCYIPTIAEFGNEDPISVDSFSKIPIHVYAKGYSQDDPDGFYEAHSVCNIDAYLTTEQFQRCQSAGFPTSPIAALRTIAGIAGKIPVLMCFDQQGKALFSKAGRLLYAAIDKDTPVILDEAQANEKYGMLGWTLIDDWKFIIKHNGAALKWDSASFNGERK